MFRRNMAARAAEAVECRDDPWPEWQSVYLEAITENRRAVNSRILDSIPRPRAFFGLRRGGRIISTALCVASHGCGVIECVATRADCRRQGAALAVLRALETWASGHATEMLGLQVVSTNTPAVALYERLGFVGGATNRFWARG
jgi:ribosomal protein S18 acetylase RimI-like enzyme